jgi:hypothetical protein
LPVKVAVRNFTAGFRIHEEDLAGAKSHNIQNGFANPHCIASGTD